MNLPKLHINDQVRVHDGRSWAKRGKIVEVLGDKPRSYKVLTENGSKIRRNRRHLLVDKHNYTDTMSDSDDGYSLIDFNEEIVNNRNNVNDNEVLVPELVANEDIIQVAPQPGDNNNNLLMDELDPIPVHPIPANDEQTCRQITTRAGRVIVMPRRYSYYETDMSQLFDDPENE